LQIKMSHKNKASLILNKTVLVNRYNNGYFSLTKNLSNLFRLTGRYKYNLDLVIIMIKQVLNS